MRTVSHETIGLILLFAVAYLVIILRKTGRSQLDLYDLVMLSTVATLPILFAVFPGFNYYISVFTGVKFPFVVLFGLLLAVIFLFINRLTARLHKLEHDNRLLVQELSLLQQHVGGDAGHKTGDDQP